MADNDKFSKTIDDEDLDEVAGGTVSETSKDIKFLTDLGMRLNIRGKKNSEILLEVNNAWNSLGLSSDVSDNKKNANLYGSEFRASESPGYIAGKKISRQDAMIYAMRAKKKYLNLEDYI